MTLVRLTGKSPWPVENVLNLSKIVNPAKQRSLEPPVSYIAHSAFLDSKWNKGIVRNFQTLKTVLKSKCPTQRGFA